MTRKRKNVEVTADQPYEMQTGHFPKKHSERERDDGEQFSSMGPQNDKEDGYPGELIKYLQNFVDILKTDGLEDDAFDKIVEECKGSEAVLLKYFDSCRIIETIFGGSKYGSSLFLQSICRLKHRIVLDMFFNSTTVKTLEKLLFTLLPISDNVQVQILSTITDILCDNWNDVFSNATSSFLIRSLAKLSCGIAKDAVNSTSAEMSSVSKSPFHTELTHLFDKLGNMAIDFSSPYSLKEMYCSLVLQDILECDITVGGGKCTQFIEKHLFLKDVDVISQLCDKSCSRVWDKAVIGCSENTRERLWEVIQPQIEMLALNAMGNHPLQNFIKSTKGEELRRNICKSIKPFMTKLLQNRYIGVVAAVVKCSETCLDVQELLIKELRIHYRATTTSQKEHFFFNVLTQNKYDGEHFDPNQADIQGGLLVRTLFELQKVKTLSLGVMSLDKDTILQMALNKICALALQAILKSETVEDTVKQHILQSFEGNWEKLIEHPIGSHTFDVVWTLADISKKQNLMKKFILVRNTSKNWKFAMLRVDLNLFRKDKKAWIAEMRNSFK